MKRKVFLFVLSLSIMATALPGYVFAESAQIQDEHDKINSTQIVTQESQEEINAAAEKAKYAEDLLNAINNYKTNKSNKDEVEQALNKFNKKYNKNLTLDSFAVIKSNAISANVASTSSSGVLGFTCYKQETDWGCGPASAYIVLKGMGKTSYNGRQLTQSNLAIDLGAQTQGAYWTGTWATTMSNWAGYRYVTTNAPSASTLLSNAYLDTVCSEGDIYDTHMSGSNELYGYALNTERYHYLAGDGYDNTNSQIHYLDPHNTNTTAYGPHWASASLMAACVHDRGMVW